MIDLTEELIRKHRALVEATVRAHTAHSKKGKTFTVKQHDRKSAKKEYDDLGVEVRSLSKQMDSIVQTGGHVDLGDPLSRRYRTAVHRRRALDRQFGFKSANK